MVRVGESRLASGWTAVTLEHESMRVSVLPEKGSEIFSLVSPRHDVDVLWKAPWGLRKPVPIPDASASSETAWMDGYAGGWQELFPNGGDACTYRGAPLGFHGEASVAPWAYEVAHDTTGGPALQLEVRLARSPFRLRKRISLDPSRPIVRIWERVTNEGTARMPFMWGHHPAYGAPFLGAGCTLRIPAATYEADTSQVTGRTWLEPGVAGPWPHASRVGGGTVDLSVVPGPEAEVANLGYVQDLREGWYALTNPRLGLGVGLAWPREVFPYLWLWQEFHGGLNYPWYGTTYVMGVEPHSSIPGHGLVNAMARGTARWLDPGEQLEMELCAVFFEGGPVRRIASDGTVER